MKLLELAKKNLQEFISVRETLELISTTQQTPLSYVATFLISQSFETNISTYDADKYYVIHSNDNWNWGQFEYTSSILSTLAENDKYKESFVFDGTDIPENLKDTYWKRSELYNLNLIKDLSLGCYFRAEDIKNIVGNRSLNLDEFESNDNFSDDEVRKLLKSGIPSYFPSSVEKFSQIDDFVKSIIDFFECDFNKGLIIQKDELKELLFKLEIIIKGFNDFLPKSYQSNNKNIWDANYLNLQLNESLDLATIDIDFSFHELADFPFESEQNLYKEQLSLQLPLHIKILAMNDYFSIVESACFISFDEPEKIQAYIDSGDFTYDAWRYGEHIQAVKVIENGIRANNLDIEKDGMIPRASLQQFLFERNHVITDFNDNLPLLANSTYGNPTIGYASPTSYQKERAQLLKEFEQLESELEQEKKQSSLLTLDYQASQSEMDQLKVKIVEIENANSNSEIDIINSDLLLISALLNTLKNEIKVKANKSQSKILQRIEDEHKGIKGLSKSRTEKVIAMANRLYKPLI